MAKKLSQDDICDYFIKTKGTKIAHVHHTYCEGGGRFFAQITDEETFVSDLLTKYVNLFFEYDSSHFKGNESSYTNSYKDAVIVSRHGGVVKFNEHLSINFRENIMEVLYKGCQISQSIRRLTIQVEHDIMVRLADPFLYMIYHPNIA